MILIAGFFSFRNRPTPLNGSSRAHAAHKVGDFSFGILPNLGAGGAVVGLGIHGVLVLIGVERIGKFLRKFFGHRVVAARIVRLNCRRADDDLGAQRLEQIDFFLGLLVGNGEDHLVAAHRGHERETHSRIAGSAFDDGATAA